jgi:hypothetical protein
MHNMAQEIWLKVIKVIYIDYGLQPYKSNVTFKIRHGNLFIYFL